MKLTLPWLNSCCYNCMKVRILQFLYYLSDFTRIPEMDQMHFKWSRKLQYGLKWSSRIGQSGSCNLGHVRGSMAWLQPSVRCGLSLYLAPLINSAVFSAAFTALVLDYLSSHTCLVSRGLTWLWSFSADGWTSFLWPFVRRIEPNYYCQPTFDEDIVGFLQTVNSSMQTAYV